MLIIAYKELKLFFIEIRRSAQKKLFYPTALHSKVIPTLVGNSSAFNEHKYLCVMDIIKKSAFAAVHYI